MCIRDRDYNTRSALLRCAMDDRTLDVVSAIIEAESESENQFQSQNIEKEVSNEYLRKICIFFHLAYLPGNCWKCYYSLILSKVGS